MSPGDVIHIWLDSEHVGGQDAKFKYLICVDPKERRFLMINSDPRTVTPSDNVQINHEEATFLPNAVSYVDTSRMIGLTFAQFRDGMAKRGAKLMGALSQETKNKIIAGAQQAKSLPRWQKPLIEKCLGPPPGAQP